MVSEFVARAGAAGFTVAELVELLRERQNDAPKTRRQS
jgi:hypothetical protein